MTTFEVRKIYKKNKKFSLIIHRRLVSDEVNLDKINYVELQFNCYVTSSHNPVDSCFATIDSDKTTLA